MYLLSEIFKEDDPLLKLAFAGHICMMLKPFSFSVSQKNPFYREPYYTVGTKEIDGQQ
jgi:hypothetical protein